MAPKYSLYSDYSVTDALEMAGKPRDDAQYQAGEPPVSFFTNPPKDPKDCAAVFSTLYGKNQFRFVDNPTPTRSGGYWWAAEIQRVCDELRRNLPDTCRYFEAPQSYWDLYKYFDAYDIYYRGAQNLWNVINTLIHENEYVQQVVENEQRMQTEQHMPLFEHLTAELMKAPAIQTKLLNWDETKEPDVLKALTIDDLQVVFTAYNTYPEHFLEAIRVMFKRHYEVLCNQGLLATGLDGTKDTNINIPYRLNALRHHLSEALDDPFMDKFEIPNKIINGIVIANGTSQPAPGKASYKLTHRFTKNSNQPGVTQRNGTDELRPALEAAANSSSENCNGIDVTNGIPTTARCASAPTIGGNPASILNSAVTDKARVFTNNGREFDNNLREVEESTTPKVASANTHHANTTPQTTTNGPGVYPLHNSSTSSQGHIYPQSVFAGPGAHQFPSAPVPPSSSTLDPGPLPPSQLPDGRYQSMPHDAFSNQIPAYALPQHMQGPPAMMQETQYPGPVHTQQNGGSYAMNAPPPNMQSGIRQHYNRAPAHAGGRGGSTEYKRNSDTLNRSNGKWQHVGSDEIHGPKVIYRKESVHSQEAYNRTAGQWRNRESFNGSSRHTSTTSTSSGYSQFNNTRPSQQYNTHVETRQTGVWGPSANLGQSLNKDGCVNAHKNSDAYTKFDPCPCSRCNERDRTIYVSGFPQGVLGTDNAIQRLKQHFSKYGKVENMYVVNNMQRSARVRLTTIQSTLAAARDRHVRIQGFGDRVVHVQFQMGSQFFKPSSRKDYTHEPIVPGHPAQNASQEQQIAMPQPQQLEQSNPNALSHSFQCHSSLHEGPAATSGSITPTTYDSGTNAAMADRAATQSGDGQKTPERPYVGPVMDLTVPFQPLHGLASTDVKHLHGTANLPEHLRGSQLDGTLHEFFRNIADLTPGATMPCNPQSANGVAHSADNAPQADDASRNEEENPTQKPESTGSVIPDEEASIDYGTVRIRPEKARYTPIPSNWRRILTPPTPTRDSGPQSPQTASQSDQISAAEDTRQVPLYITSRLGNGQWVYYMEEGNTINFPPNSSNEYLEAIIHTKRKASEPDGDEGASAQSSHKKKLVKISQPGSHVPESQGSQAMNDDRQGPGQTKTGKKKKNKRKNRQDHGTGASAPETSPATALYTSQTFQPVISRSNLPPYPQEPTQEMESEPRVLHISPPAHIWRPHKNQNAMSHGIEPFPAYRDTMSGPQLSVLGHKRSTTGLGPSRSISSNASTIMQDSDQILNGLNPGAQNFAPSPAHMNPENSTTPAQDPRVSDRNADDSKAPRFTNKDNGNRMDTGTRRGGGTNKYKSGWKNNRKNISTEAATDKNSCISKAETSGPAEPKDATDLNRSQVLSDQKVQASKKQGVPDDTNGKLPSSTEAQLKETVNHGRPQEAKADRQDKGKGKEVISPKKKLDATTAIETKSDNDRKTKVKDHKRSKSQTDLGSPKKSQTASLASDASSSTSTKPRKGKTKNRTSPQKNNNTQPSTKSNNIRPENTTAKGPAVPSSKPQQGAKGPRAQPAKPLINADDFPALLPKRAVTLAPIPLCFPQIANPWQKGRKATMPALSSTPVAAKPKDGEGDGDKGNGNGTGESSKEKEVAIPDGERKGG
ncbi:hypothetical protein GGR55DRAFT_376694 [Xylaria sp. FL0064]|nr:hypothetical protein GGR55DRAFT_376694 [Xylaria sp. FL0064]